MLAFHDNSINSLTHLFFCDKPIPRINHQDLDVFLRINIPHIHSIVLFFADFLSFSLTLSHSLSLSHSTFVSPSSLLQSCVLLFFPRELFKSPPNVSLFLQISSNLLLMFPYFFTFFHRFKISFQILQNLTGWAALLNSVAEHIYLIPGTLKPSL